MFLCTLASLTLAFGQSATTSLRGVIKDPSGALVSGAKITLVDSAKGTALSATSGSTGLYVFAQIPPAHYKISVTASGFGDQSKTAELLVNQPATIDFTMNVQTSTVTVDVSAAAQTINTTDATIGNSVGNEAIETLPLDGREPAALLSLQPGVLFLGQKGSDAGSDGRQGAVSGSRSDQSSISVDGIDDNDQANGYAFQGVLRSTLDSTEEFRVTTSNGNADSGRSSGAQISLVTKSGTNKFHGALYEYHRPTNTVANDWFLKQSQIASGIENRPTKYVQNVFGGTVGGPIWKDKLFFFFNYEGQRIATNEAVSDVTTPTASFLTDHELKYIDVNGDTQTITEAQIAQLDAGCTQCSTYGVTPGVSAAMMSYYANVPVANGSSLGDGLNSGSYVFSSPRPQRFNTSIFKLDYNLNSTNHLFARGNLQKDILASVEQFPGQPASSRRVDNSKGMVFGHTWTPTASIVNDVRYGYIRQGYADAGIGQGQYVFVRFLTQPTAQTRSTITSVPVHNITDSLTINKGNHTILLGGSWHNVTVNSSSDANSYSGASTNPNWLGGNPPDPTTLGLPAVSDGFQSDYAVAYTTIVGNVPSLTKVYNYNITSATSATLLNEGSIINRHFRSNEFEYFLQDSWRITPKLTVMLGVHHSLLQTPYETKGQQIAPTVDTHQWFLDRATAAAKGTVNQPDLTFAPNGKANGKPSFWPKQKMNLAPRASIVYALDPKTAIRAGAGLYFDHFGEGMSQRLSSNASFGLSTSITNSAAVYSYETSPRFTGPHNLPNISVASADQTETFPYTYPEGNGAIVWGVDNRLKTPYTESMNLSVQRELPAGFTLEVSYLGRMGRHLFQTVDLAEPVDYVDPKGAGDYYTAGAALSKVSDAAGGCNIYSGNGCTVPTITPDQYWEDVFPQMQNYDYEGESATEAIYNNEWAPYRYTWGATQAIYDIDYSCYYGCPNGTLFWQPQFASLYAKSSIGMSYYNAGQLVLRHPTSHGLNLDFSYTWSKSIDMGSDVERAGYGYGAIQNSFRPALNRGVSDFDTKHLVTTDYSYLLPLGRGKLVAANAGHLLDTIIGGWQWSGLARYTSGLPFSVNEQGYTTNWELGSWGVQTGKVKLRKHYDSDGTPQAFDDPTAIQNGVTTGGPIRVAYPGEAGQRNPYRGEGFFNIDSSLNKSFGLGEFGKLRFAWDVFNVTNSVRFDVYSLGSTITTSSLGKYSSELGGNAPFRHMQFSLRYDF
ncbi:MAG: TonB-dependent receptor [Terracidiphilus sp.]|nr:TonB-dependent receptor [Terracidiphilus sp.]